MTVLNWDAETGTVTDYGTLVSSNGSDIEITTSAAHGGTKAFRAVGIPTGGGSTERFRRAAVDNTSQHYYFDVWIKFEQTQYYAGYGFPGSQAFLFFGPNGYSLARSSSNKKLYLVRGEPSLSYCTWSQASATDYPDTDWFNISGHFDREAGTIVIKLNGVEIITRSGGVDQVIASAGLGVHSDSFSSESPIIIDDFKVSHTPFVSPYGAYVLKIR